VQLWTFSLCNFLNRKATSALAPHILLSTPFKKCTVFLKKPASKVSDLLG